MSGKAESHAVPHAAMFRLHREVVRMTSSLNPVSQGKSEALSQWRRGKSWDEARAVRVQKRYRTIVADPPWHYDTFATMPGNPKKKGHVTKREPMQYPSLSVMEIAALPVGELAAPDCALWLWTTNRYLREAFDIVEAWGFEYRQTLVWHKTGNPSPFGGTAAPNHAEYLLLGAKGKPKWGRWKSSVIQAPKPYEHSRKPEAFLDIIEAISPAPRVELFARRNRLGWDTWGNESLEHVELA